MRAPSVVVLDYGSGNLRSAERALHRVGADVTVTADPHAALTADGLMVPGVGAYAACMAGLRAAKGDRIIDERLAGSRPVLGVCVGMQVLFERGVEFAHHAGSDHATTEASAGCGQWPGTVEALRAKVLPHMGWNTVEAPRDSALFAGIPTDTRFYFVHSYGAQYWKLAEEGPLRAPVLTWAEHGCRFLAAVENGPLSATQFHPEKSGDTGAALLENWVRGL